MFFRDSFRGRLQGEVAALLAAVSWGIFAPAFKSATATAALLPLAASTFGVAAVASLFWNLGRPGFWSVWSRPAWRSFLAVFGFIMLGNFGLIFVALTLTSSGNVALLAATELLPTVVVFWFLGERLTRGQLIGAAVTLLGAVLILLPRFTGQFAVGEVLVLVACLSAVAGNYFQKNLLQHATTASVLFWRNLLAALLFGGWTFWTATTTTVATLLAVWPWLFLGGVVGLFLSKIFIFTAFRAIGISRTLAIETAAPAVSLLAAYFWLDEVPTVWQLAGLASITAGVWCSLRFAKTAA